MRLPIKVRSLNSATARQSASKVAHWANCLADHRVFSQCTFNVRNFSGQGRAHQSIAVFRDDNHVLDADSDRFLRNVDARFDSDYITGCERAGKDKRAVMDSDWVRDIEQQCQEAGKLHYFKQAYVDERGIPNEEPLLDGQIVQQVPTTQFPLAMAMDSRVQTRRRRSR